MGDTSDGDAAAAAFAGMADACDNLAFDIESRRRDGDIADSSDVTDRLGSLEDSLRTKARALRTLGVGMLLQNAPDALPALTRATTDANAAIGKLKTAQQAVTIAGLLLSVAAGALSGNLGTILSSVAALSAAVGLLTTA